MLLYASIAKSISNARVISWIICVKAKQKMWLCFWVSQFFSARFTQKVTNGLCWNFTLRWNMVRDMQSPWMFYCYYYNCNYNYNNYYWVLCVSGVVKLPSGRAQSTCQSERRRHVVQWVHPATTADIHHLILHTSCHLPHRHAVQILLLLARTTTTVTTTTSAAAAVAAIAATTVNATSTGSTIAVF